MRTAAVLAASGLLLFLSASPAQAHGIGGRSDLPVPLSYFIVGAALVLVFTFVLLAVLWVEPRLQDGPRRTVLGWSWAKPVFGLLQAFGVIGLVLVIAAGLFGTPAGSRNIAPVLVWVYFWLVIPFLSVAFGNLWAAVNPWRTLGNVTLTERDDRDIGSRVGVLPAVVAFIAFTWLELVYPQSSLPLALAIAALVYTAYLGAAMAWVGPTPGLRAADAFTSYNRYLSSIAPFGLSEGQVIWRGWLRALPVLPAWRGATLFVVAMIGTVTYDGLSATPLWRETFGSLASNVWFGTFALVASVAVIAGAYWAASALASYLSADPASQARVVARRFAHSLVPIAFAYAFAHYFTLVIFEGQILIAVASDPFGQGWDLFGTADYRIEFGLISPNAVWLLQVAAIVGGHVAGVVLAHDRALADFPARTAVRTQYAMLGLMVLLTSLGLAILAAG
ncbi:MAG: hypothetical protein ACE5MI_07425 [Acidimicrobiia bacterium]